MSVTPSGLRAFFRALQYWVLIGIAVEHVQQVSAGLLENDEACSGGECEEGASGGGSNRNKIILAVVLLAASLCFCLMCVPALLWFCIKFIRRNLARTSKNSRAKPKEGPGAPQAPTVELDSIHIVTTTPTAQLEDSDQDSGNADAILLPRSGSYTGEFLDKGKSVVHEYKLLFSPWGEVHGSILERHTPTDEKGNSLPVRIVRKYKIRGHYNIEIGRFQWGEARSGDDYIETFGEVEDKVALWKSIADSASPALHTEVECVNFDNAKGVIEAWRFTTNGTQGPMVLTLTESEEVARKEGIPEKTESSVKGVVSGGGSSTHGQPPITPVEKSLRETHSQDSRKASKRTVVNKQGDRAVWMY
ncbi:hypothetical protein BSKO_05975 [Bryopsis sp. KO-2023]|nr:hypothetical protein BSKO_05975 [Bryopsis sp. KO-2023]